MQAFGLLFIAVGFSAGAFIGVLEPEGVPWAMFAPALLVGIIGVVLVQVAMRRRAHDVSHIEGNFETLDAKLRSIVAKVQELDDRKDEIDVYELPGRIDQRLPEEIVAFADARSSITHAWGPRAYADVMSPFAAGERYLNRVWSCAADGYIDEAHASLTQSRKYFEDALAQFESGKSAASAAT